MNQNNLICIQGIESGTKEILDLNLNEGRIGYIAHVVDGNHMSITWYDRWDEGYYTTHFVLRDGIWCLRSDDIFIQHLVKYHNTPIFSDDVLTEVYNSADEWNPDWRISTEGLMFHNGFDPETIDDDLRNYDSLEMFYDGRRVMNCVHRYPNGEFAWFVDYRVLL